jgi:hypothetical protein
MVRYSSSDTGSDTTGSAGTNIGQQHFMGTGIFFSKKRNQMCTRDEMGTKERKYI